MKAPEVTDLYLELAIQRLANKDQVEANGLRRVWVDYEKYPRWNRPSYVKLQIEAIKNTALAIAYEYLEIPLDEGTRQEVLSDLLKKAEEGRSKASHLLDREIAYNEIISFLLAEIALGGETEVVHA